MTQEMKCFFPPTAVQMWFNHQQVSLGKTIKGKLLLMAAPSVSDGQVAWPPPTHDRVEPSWDELHAPISSLSLSVAEKTDSHLAGIDEEQNEEKINTDRIKKAAFLLFSWFMFLSHSQVRNMQL